MYLRLINKLPIENNKFINNISISYFKWSFIDILTGIIMKSLEIRKSNYAWKSKRTVQTQQCIIFCSFQQLYRNHYHVFKDNDNSQVKQQFNSPPVKTNKFSFIPLDRISLKPYSPFQILWILIIGREELLPFH